MIALFKRSLIRNALYMSPLAIWLVGSEIGFRFGEWWRS